MPRAIYVPPEGAMVRVVAVGPGDAYHGDPTAIGVIGTVSEAHDQGNGWLFLEFAQETPSRPAHWCYRECRVEALD